MPELPIPATPDELAQAIMQAPPKKRWRYMDKHEWQEAGTQGQPRRIARPGPTVPASQLPAL